MEDSPAPELEAPFQWGRRDLIAFVAFFAATVVFLPGGVFLVFRLFQPGLQLETLSGVQLILIQTVMDFLVVAFIFFLVGILHKQPIFRTLRFVRNGNVAVGRWISAGILLAITATLIPSLFPPPPESPLEKLLTTTSSIVLFAILGIAVAPLLEEIIFRGFIFTALMDLYGSKAAVPITAVLFAALHVTQLRGNWPAIGVILLVGYVLTVVRHRTDSVIPSAIMHTAYNAMIFGLAALGSLLADGKSGTPN